MQNVLSEGAVHVRMLDSAIFVFLYLLQKLPADHVSELGRKSLNGCVNYSLLTKISYITMGKHLPFSKNTE